MTEEKRFYWFVCKCACDIQCPLSGGKCVVKENKPDLPDKQLIRKYMTPTEFQQLIDYTKQFSGFENCDEITEEEAKTLSEEWSLNFPD